MLYLRINLYMYTNLTIWNSQNMVKHLLQEVLKVLSFAMWLSGPPCKTTLLTTQLALVKARRVNTTYIVPKKKRSETLIGLATNLCLLPQEYIPGTLDSDTRNTATWTRAAKAPHWPAGPQHKQCKQDERLLFWVMRYLGFMLLQYIPVKANVQRVCQPRKWLRPLRECVQQETHHHGTTKTQRKQPDSNSYLVISCIFS